MSELSTAAPLLSPQQVADYLGVPVATVYTWRARGGGPRAHRVGKHLRYQLSDVENWLSERADEPREGRTPRYPPAA